VSLYKMIDAAFPPPDAAGASAVAGYIGGNTPHVWTRAEWQRFAHVRQFPIWVGSGRTNGSSDGKIAVSAVRALGWAAHRPHRRAIICDVETNNMRAYLDDFAAEVWGAGFQTEVYESMSVVAANPGKEGIWVADWDGIMDLPRGTNAHQYVPNVKYEGTEIDISVVSGEFMQHGGEGART